MDRLFRLTWALFMLACAVALLSPRLAHAESWEYAEKVVSTTGGVAKSQQNGPIQEWHLDAKTWNGGTFPGGYGTPGELEASYSAFISSVFGSNCSNNNWWCNNSATVTLESGPAIYGSIGGCQSNPGCYQLSVRINGTEYDATGAHWMQGVCTSEGGTVTGLGTCSLLACPAGKVEGAGGLCYETSCPDGYSEFGDPLLCRKAAPCPYPQNPDPQTAECTCPTGSVGQFGSAGIWEDVWFTTNIPTTNPLPLPDTFCGVEKGNKDGCQVLSSQGGWNGYQLEVSGKILTGEKCSFLIPSDDENLRPCPLGQVRGEINGQSVCVKGGSTEQKEDPKTETETKTNPDGTSTETTTETECTTSCAGLACTKTCTVTTTTVSKDANGNTTGTETETKTTTTQTGNGPGGGGGEGSESSFGGACGGFFCDGDAVQCAMALEQHKRNCEVLEDKGAFTRENAEAEFDETRNFDKAQLTTEGTLGTIAGSSFLGGSCMPDQYVTVGGEQFTVPFSSLCDYLAAAGAAFLVVCYLISFGIVARGVTA